MVGLVSERSGFFRPTGNPAALFDEIDTTHAFMVVSARSTSGSYRRPLDPPTVTMTGLSIGGWKRVGARSSAIGRVSVEREYLSAGTYGASVAPYGAGPFVPADTNAPPLVRPIVSLEGGQGIALGRWRVGISGSYEALENNSSKGGAGHVGRRAVAGVTVGAVRHMGKNWTVGVLARHGNESEVLTLLPNPSTIRVYALDGYLDVRPVDYSPLSGPFYRRSVRAGNALGGGVAGYTGGVAWTLSAETQSLGERQISDVSSNPPTQRWHLAGYATDASARMSGNGKYIVVQARYGVRRGETQGGPTRQAPFITESRTLTAVAEGRYRPTSSPWGLGAAASIVGGHEDARDVAASVETSIISWQPGATVEITREVRTNLHVALAYGIAQYVSRARIPEPRGRGAAYERFVAPMIELAAAASRSQLQAASAAWARSSRVFTFRIERVGLAPSSPPASSLLPLPSGTRTAWSLSLAVQ